MKYDIDEILKTAPHRYPFLLVDSIESIEDEGITAKKSVTFNEPFFEGHFPENPIYPGVLLIEGMAQTSGFLIKKKYIKEGENPLPLFLGIENAKFLRKIIPGDIIYYHASIVQKKGNFFKIKCTVKVDGKICVKALLFVTYADA